LSHFENLEVLASSVNKKIIVIDAGHGGWDPGKVGQNNELEKEINLAIAEKLQIYLELGGAVVFLTRADDTALADKKNADLTARCIMPSDMQADIFISIHQNAFPSEKVKGAQVFYYEGSQESQRLAENIQDNLETFLDNGSKKQAAANKSYFLLKETKTPAIIVECGFLTNIEEAKLLCSGIYQEKIAWGIYLGVLEHFRI